MAGAQSQTPPNGLVIGVDVGTSSTKGVLVGLDGRIRETRVLEHRVQRPFPGHVEMRGEVWWEEFLTIARELVACADEPVLAVGVSGMGPCALLTDEAGEPVRPAILYGIDMRATEQIERLGAQLSDEELLARAGSLLTTQAVGPKLAWLAEHEPEAFSRARRLFMPASWLAFKLTGAYVLDHHSASQSVPLYDSRALAWHEPWARPLAGDIELPRLQWPGDVAGAVTAEAAELTGLAPGTPVITGTIDAWSEAISVGGQRPGDLMLMYGTTLFMIHTDTHRMTHPLLWGTVGAVPGTYNLAAGMATSGAITAWLRDLTGADYASLTAEAAEVPAGSRGLLMLPYFAGERTPIFDPDARGLILGLTVEHGRAELYRAALEATAFGVRHSIAAMHDADAAISRIVAAGGGVTGRLWPQIITDVTGIPQELPTHAIGASFGAAFLAAEAVADVSIERWNPAAGEATPDPERHERYSALFEDYLALYPATVDVAHRLAARQRADRRDEARSAR